MMLNEIKVKKKKGNNKEEANNNMIMILIKDYSLIFKARHKHNQETDIPLDS